MPPINPNAADDPPDALLCCIRRGSDLNFLRDFNPGDWTALLKQAGRYSLGPLLYQRLVREHPGENLVPEEFEKMLREAYYQTLTENTRAYHLLGQVLQCFEEEKTRVIPLKGAYLADLVYGDIGLRPMGDLDLLVPEEDFQRSLSLLAGLGFTSERPYSDESDGDLHFHAPPFCKDGIVIELHWKLVLSASPVQMDIAGLWERARRITLENSQAWAMAKEDLILHLCVHAAYGHEFYTQLRSLVDIAEVLHPSSQPVDWETVNETAQKWQAGRGVYLCLALANEMFGAGIPENAIETLKPPERASEALDWARQRLFRKEPELSASFLRLMSPDLSPIRRFQALIYGLFPPRPVMTMIYGFPPGSWRTTARYLPHAANRIHLYWGHFMRRLRGDPLPTVEAESTLALKHWLGIRT